MPVFDNDDDLVDIGVDEISVAAIMAFDPLFWPAWHGLDSTDYEVFQASKLTVQACAHRAIARLTTDCPDCVTDAPAQFCAKHKEMFEEVETMLTSEDAPVFQGE